MFTTERLAKSGRRRVYGAHKRCANFGLWFFCEGGGGGLPHSKPTGGPYSALNVLERALLHSKLTGFFELVQIVRHGSSARLGPITVAGEVANALLLFGIEEILEIAAHAVPLFR